MRYLSLFLIGCLSLNFQVSWAGTLQYFYEGNKVGLQSEDGSVILPAVYDELGWSPTKHFWQDILNTFQPKQDPPLFRSLLAYRDGGNWGLVNMQNKKVTEANFSQLMPYGQQQILAAKNGKIKHQDAFGLLDEQGKVLIGFQYASIRPASYYSPMLSKELHIVSQKDFSGSYYGLIDHKENPLIQIKFKDLKVVSNGLVAVQNDLGKVAIYKADGYPLSEFDYDSLVGLNSQYSLIYQAGFAGMVNQEGKLLIEADFKAIKIENNEWRVKKYPLWTVRRNDKAPLFSLRADRLEPYAPSLYKMNLQGYEALVDADGKSIIKMSAARISALEEGVLISGKASNLQVKDRFGEPLLPDSYDSVWVERPFIYALKQNGLGQYWQVFDRDGKLISQQRYEYVQPFHKQRARIKRNGKYGLMNPQGEELLPCHYDWMEPLDHANVIVKHLGQYGLMDLDGNWLIKARKDSLIRLSSERFLLPGRVEFKVIDENDEKIFSSIFQVEAHALGFLVYDEKGVFGLLDGKGKEILPISCKSLSGPENGLYIAKNTYNEFAAVNSQGKVMIPFSDRFSEMFGYAEEFLAIREGNKYGFVDLQARLRISNQYDSVAPFYKDRAPVKLMGKWGFVDHAESLVIQPLYESVNPFENGLAIVNKAGKYGIINSEGKTILPFHYQHIRRSPTGRFIVKKDGAYGLVDAEGVEVIYPRYQYFQDLPNDEAIVGKNGLFGVMDLQGLNVLPMIYQEVLYDPHSGYYFTREDEDWKEYSLESRAVKK